MEILHPCSRSIELARISTRIERTEEQAKRVIPSSKHLTIQGDHSWKTTAPNEGIYQCSPLPALWDFLEWGNLKPSSTAILGGGLGGAAFVFSRFSIFVKVWEADIILHALSKNIAGELGFPYNLIDFKLANFLLDKEDISDFDTIYFHKPFNKNYRKLMGDKLEKTRKGTVVISPTQGMPFNLMTVLCSPASFKLVLLGLGGKHPFDVFERI